MIHTVSHPTLAKLPNSHEMALESLFGGFGGTLGMFVFRHKTKHWYFRVFFPLLMVLQFGLLGYLLGTGIL